MTKETKETVIASFTNCWDDEIRIIDVNGTLFKETNGEREPMRFNTHDGGGSVPDGDILNHANVQACGWEVEEDGYRNFCATVCMPSSCFNDDIELKDDLSKEAIQAIKDWAAADLEIADKKCEENLKPLQAESIVEDFAEWYDEQEDILTDEDYADDYLEEVQKFRRGYIPNFHDDDEIKEICRNYLKGE